MSVEREGDNEAVHGEVGGDGIPLEGESTWTPGSSMCTVVSDEHFTRVSVFW